MKKLKSVDINSEKVCSDRKLEATLEQLQHENHFKKIFEKKLISIDKSIKSKFLNDVKEEDELETAIDNLETKMDRIYR